MGNLETPFQAIPLLMEAGASFAARTFSARMPHMVETFRQAILHRGFSFVEVLQPCVSFHNTYEYYSSRVYELDYLPTNETEAFRLSKQTEQIALGIFRQKSRPLFHEALYQHHNPLRDRCSRPDRIKKLDTFFTV
jgi:2-oxoglutarate ferredoxin oxidoreductase subunit beta